MPYVSRICHSLDEHLTNHTQWDSRGADGAADTLGTRMEAAGASKRVREIGRRSVRAGTLATADLRDPPDLVIIGVKRGGTTSLFRDLERHPAMCPLVPSARRLPLRENMKGVHYFDSDMARSARWYRSHFATRTAKWWRRRRVGAAFTAEASPYYFFHPLAAHRAAATLPDTVFAVMLRDPVERTVSHWAEQSRNGVETLSLGDALRAEPRRVGDAAAALVDGTIGASHAHEQQSFAGQSEYAASLERWIDAVGRERLIVLYSEDYYRDPATTLTTITERLAVAPMPAGDDIVHRNAAQRAGSLDAALERELIERFRPDVVRLGALLGAQPPWPRFAS